MRPHSSADQDQHACSDREDRHDRAGSREVEIEQRHQAAEDQPDCQQQHAEIPSQSHCHSESLLSRRCATILLGKSAAPHWGQESTGVTRFFGGETVPQLSQTRVLATPKYAIATTTTPPTAAARCCPQKSDGPKSNAPRMAIDTRLNGGYHRLRTRGSMRLP